MSIIILSFLTAFTLTYFAIPPIIRIAKQKHLFDVPGERSSHTVKTPALGGIGIFAGAIFSIVLWTPFEQFGNLQYILCGFIILFLIGVKDDLSPMSPRHKMIGQILAAAILVIKSDIHLSGFYGLFGLHDELHELFYLFFSMFTILVIINAFNLIDGINGLAGSVGALISGVLGCWFFWAGKMELAIVAFTMVGSIIAFLKYNYTPAKIFMGDTGSLIVGMGCAVLILEFMHMNYSMSDTDPRKFYDVPAVAVGIMIIPLFDTIRVFTTRIYRGHSPFKPDRRHIHHLLIDYGFTHMQATGTLVAVNILYILFVFSFHNVISLHLMMLLVIGSATGLTYLLHSKVVQKKNKHIALG